MEEVSGLPDRGSQHVFFLVVNGFNAFGYSQASLKSCTVNIIRIKEEELDEYCVLFIELLWKYPPSSGSRVFWLRGCSRRTLLILGTGTYTFPRPEEAINPQCPFFFPLQTLKYRHGFVLRNLASPFRRKSLTGARKNYLTLPFTSLSANLKTSAKFLFWFCLFMTNLERNE